MKAKVMDALKKTFRPEFINRLDGIMVFRSLSRDEIAQIVELELRPLRMQMAEQEMKLELTPAARLAIAEAGYDPEYGARPLRRIIQNQIQDPLSEGMLAEKISCPATRSRLITAKARRRTAAGQKSSFSTSPTTRNQVLLQQLDDELILLDLQSGRYFGLQAVGARAWELLTTTGDTDAVLAAMLTEYAVDAVTLRQDLDELWQGLLDAGLIVVATDA
jgi:hypothetical protein